MFGPDIESLQRRALRIIFPNSSYQQAVDQANLTSLADRRIFICKKLMADMKRKRTGRGRKKIGERSEPKGTLGREKGGGAWRHAFDAADAPSSN